MSHNVCLSIIKVIQSRPKRLTMG